MQKVTAAVIQLKGKILIAKRKPGGQIGGKWEFPGGKIEENETLEEGLKREIKEELDIIVEIGELIGTTTFSTKRNNQNNDYELYFFQTIYKAGNIKTLEHEAIAWVTLDELAQYDLADSDKKLVPLIIQSIKKN
jgi:mutator protein MutT